MMSNNSVIERDQAATQEAQNGQLNTVKRFTFRTPDGVKISAQEWGNPNGAEILFIHGFSQSHLSWSCQVKSDLAMRFRMITYDIRGHGESDKPEEAIYYQEEKRWAGEVKAIIEEANLNHPVVVAWSYGGRILLDYLTHYGDAGIAGINFVGGLTTVNDPTLFGPGAAKMRMMLSVNLEENIESTVAFLQYCTARPLPPEEFTMLVASNMVVPPSIRTSMLGRPLSFEKTLAGITKPVLVTHGAKDETIRPAMSQYTANAIANAQLSIYEGSGHMPFWENPARFNHELAGFTTAQEGDKR
jgi:pimeloyl-ACP methyl ester carboxylesterase